MEISRAGSRTWPEVEWIIISLPETPKRVYGYHLNFNLCLCIRKTHRREIEVPAGYIIGCKLSFTFNTPVALKRILHFFLE